MTSIYHNAEILKMNIKQYSNKMATLDKVWYAIKNKTNENPRFMSRHNHLYLEYVIDYIKRLGLFSFMWEGNMHGEKCKKIERQNSLLKEGTIMDKYGQKRHAQK